MRYWTFPIAFFLATVPAIAQQPDACTSDTLYQLLDFWVGEWNVYDEKDTLVGQNRIEKILNSCAVTELWRGKSGGEGRSLFYVDNDTREWRQVWVTGSAKQPWGQKEKTLIYSEPGQLLIFQGTYVYNGNPLLDRTLLKKVSGDRVKQTIQVSADGGQSWRTTFVGDYRRK